MTLVTTQIYGYEDQPYLDNGTVYLGGTNAGNSGLQFTVNIDSSLAKGMQFQGVITKQPAYGTQFKGVISTTKSYGLQYQGVLSKQANYGLQFEVHVNSSKSLGFQYNVSDTQRDAHGLQFSASVLNYQAARGLQFRKDVGFVTHYDCGGAGYLEGGYETGPYLAPTNCVHGGLQYKGIISKQPAYGLQFRVSIESRKALGTQFKGVISKQPAYGLQFTVTQADASGMQFTVVLYNTDNLRILCDFPSRGVVDGNWTANSTMAGDFDVGNLNTDIVEQVWRSNNIVTSIQLKCDTGIPQGVFIDTLAILGHNFTSGANVVVEGSNASDFSSIGQTIVMQAAAADTGNTFYIAPEYPLQGFRYWRVSIDDVSNADGFIEIGAILFGTATIIQGENIIDEIEREFRDFADTVRTMGYTNVSNSRAIKKVVRIGCHNWSFQYPNFRQLNAMFRRDRTTFKCLWIPTPDPVDQEYTERFAVFGKLSKIPAEKHNSKGAKADYIDLDIEVDESL